LLIVISISVRFPPTLMFLFPRRDSWSKDIQYRLFARWEIKEKLLDQLRRFYSEYKDCGLPPLPKTKGENLLLQYMKSFPFSLSVLKGLSHEIEIGLNSHGEIVPVPDFGRPSKSGSIRSIKMYSWA
jgi:hypothetical protein